MRRITINYDLQNLNVEDHGTRGRLTGLVRDCCSQMGGIEKVSSSNNWETMSTDYPEQTIVVEYDPARLVELSGEKMPVSACAGLPVPSSLQWRCIMEGIETEEEWSEYLIADIKIRLKGFSHLIKLETLEVTNGIVSRAA